MTAIVETLPILSDPFPARNNSLVAVTMPTVNTDPPDSSSSDDELPTTPVRAQFPPRRSSLAPAAIALDGQLHPTDSKQHHHTSPPDSRQLASTAPSPVQQSRPPPTFFIEPDATEAGSTTKSSSDSSDTDDDPDDLSNIMGNTLSLSAPVIVESVHDDGNPPSSVSHLRPALANGPQPTSEDKARSLSVDSMPILGLTGVDEPAKSSAAVSLRPIQSAVDVSAAKKLKGLRSGLRRRSWMPGSRSPSPRKGDPKTDKRAASLTDLQLPQPESAPKTVRKETMTPIISNSGGQAPRQTALSKQVQKFRKRQSSGTKLDTLADTSPTKQPNRPATGSSADKASVSTSRSSDRLGSYKSGDLFSLTLSSKQRLARKRDELWATFRDLENAHTKFMQRLSDTTKAIDHKSGIVRNALMPFLKSTSAHPSNFGLHPEDLDRRASILFKWWSGLVDFLRDRFTACSNAVRMLLFDAIFAIIERNEWRHHPSPFCPTLAKQTTDRSSEASSISEGDYLVESVQHSIRTWFSQCLAAQLTFAIDKMHHFPASRSIPVFVAFCGKTCAYAYMFCPGVAMTLIRLWHPKVDLIKLVLDDAGLGASADLSDSVDKFSPQLPSAILGTHYSSMRTAVKFLKAPLPTPSGTEKINWNGPWVERWSGADSDLFYSFLRQYYQLMWDYVPDATRQERLALGGGVYIQAQILVNMQQAIRMRPMPAHASLGQVPPPLNQQLRAINHANPTKRQHEILRSIEFSEADDAPRVTPRITFDDMLGADPDVVASPIQPPPRSDGEKALLATNACIPMQDNRMINLLKELLLTSHNQPVKDARDVYAQMFADLVRCLAKSTRQFDRYASIHLCDFLEEAAVVLTRYERTNGIKTSFLDWSFWFKVWRRMADTFVTETETRVYTLIYTLWPVITIDQQRKEELCFNFLLDQEFFERRFSHFSTSVRAFYMRLLCWRVARSNEDRTEDDLKIVECLSDRLNRVYGVYLYLVDDATTRRKVSPSTVPNSPGPQLRWMIHRDNYIRLTKTGAVVKYDAPLTQDNASFKRSLLLDQLCSPDVGPEDRPKTAMSFASSTASETDYDHDESPKRWTGGLLRTIIGPSRNGAAKSQSAGRPSMGAARPESQQSPPRTNTGNSSTDEQTSARESSDKDSATAPFETFCFKLQLLVLKERAEPHPPIELRPPRLPRASQALLIASLRRTSNNDDTDFKSRRFSSINPRASMIRETLIQPVGSARQWATYCGHALAEWTLVVAECDNFFSRRRAEGVPSERWVETPLLERGPRPY